MGEGIKHGPAFHNFSFLVLFFCRFLLSDVKRGDGSYSPDRPSVALRQETHPLTQRSEPGCYSDVTSAGALWGATGAQRHGLPLSQRTQLIYSISKSWEAFDSQAKSRGVATTQALLYWTRAEGRRERCGMNTHSETCGLSECMVFYTHAEWVREGQSASVCVILTAQAFGIRILHPPTWHPSQHNNIIFLH